jgi:hypothetical protein
MNHFAQIIQWSSKKQPLGTAVSIRDIADPRNGVLRQPVHMFLHWRTDQFVFEIIFRTLKSVMTFKLREGI